MSTWRYEFTLPFSYSLVPAIVVSCIAFDAASLVDSQKSPKHAMHAKPHQHTGKSNHNLLQHILLTCEQNISGSCQKWLVMVARMEEGGEVECWRNWKRSWRWWQKKKKKGGRSEGPVFGACFACTTFAVMRASKWRGHGSDEAASWTN